MLHSVTYEQHEFEDGFRAGLVKGIDNDLEPFAKDVLTQDNIRKL